jgi:membrane-associated phospholipid phosphatase
MADGAAATARRLVAGAYPMGLVALLYAAMGRVRDVGVSQASVHLCDLHAREVALFGVPLNGARVAPNDWWLAHPYRTLDALCAFPYATFILVCVGFAVWLYGHDYARMVRFAWCFLALNVVGFATYHLYPAAPPWYFHAHGCAVDTAAKASEGPALARFDAWIGVPYFARMYARSSAVFGAIPSLHVAYALLVALEGWSVFSTGWRAASVAFFLLMCFAAVYLDHHWIEDVLAGAACSVAVAAAARALTPSPCPAVAS